MRKNFCLTVFDKKTLKYEKWKFVCTKGEMRRKIDMLTKKYIPIFVANNGQIVFLGGIK